MRIITFIVLFLVSYVSFAAGNVHIYHNGTIEKKQIWAITMCGKAVMYVYNHYGRTKVVYRYKISRSNKKQINKIFVRIRDKNGKHPAIVLKWPCTLKKESYTGRQHGV